MSKQVKDMILSDYKGRFEDTSDAVLVNLRGIEANSTNEIRQNLSKKDIRLTVIRNRLAKQAFEGTDLEGLTSLLTGPTTMAYGGDSVVEVAREIVDLVKKFPDVELRGAILDGDVYEGEDGVTRLSKFPTKDEAIAQDLTLVLSPGRNLLGQIKGPGSAVAGLIKAVEDKLEKGEQIQKAS